MEKKKLFLISLGHLSCDINGGALPALLPFLIASHGYSYQAAAGLMFAYSCLSSFIQPLFGYLSDRISRPWFLPLGVLLAGGGLATIGFWQHYMTIFLAVAVSGVGASLFHPEGARYANKVSGASKGTGISLFSMGGNAGFVLGPLLAVTTVGAVGIRGTAAFGLLSVVTASILLCQVSRIRDRTAGISGEKDLIARQKGTAIPRDGDGGDEQQRENNWREFAKLTVVIISRSVLFVGFNTFIPLYWIHVFGQSQASGALALTCFGAFGVASNFIGGLLADRYGYLRIIRISYLLLIPVVFLFTSVSGVFPAFVLLIPLGMALYAPFSSMVVLGQQYLAKNIGFASGVTLGLATSVGGMMAPVLGGIADAWGLPGALQSLMLVAVAGALLSFFLRSDSVPGRRGDPGDRGKRKQIR